MQIAEPKCERSDDKKIEIIERYVRYLGIHGFSRDLRAVDLSPCRHHRPYDGAGARAEVQSEVGVAVLAGVRVEAEAEGRRQPVLLPNPFARALQFQEHDDPRARAQLHLRRLHPLLKWVDRPRRRHSRRPGMVAAHSAPDR